MIRPKTIRPASVPKDHQERLEKAVKAGNLTEVKQLIEANGVGDPSRGIHLLRLAINGRHPLMVQLLLRRDIKPDVEGKAGEGMQAEEIPLHLACSLGLTDIARMCLKRGARIDRTDPLSRTALYYCYESTDTARMLLEKGASLSHTDRYYRTPLDAFLMDLDKCKHPYQMIKLFLEHGSPPTNVRLIHLIQNGFLKYPELFPLVPQLGIDVNSKDLDGHTALILAVREARHIDAEHLLALGSDMYARSGPKSWTAFHWAAAENNWRAIVMLLKEGFDFGTQDEDGNTALHIACEKDHEQSTHMLLKNEQADPTVVNKEGRTCLHSTISGKALSVLDLLLYGTETIEEMVPYIKRPTERYLKVIPSRHKIPVVKSDEDDGININAADNNGLTPLMLAADQQSRSMLRDLLKKGADFEARDLRGRSALTIAIERDSAKIVDILLDVGVDVTSRLPDGSTPLHLAVERRPIERTRVKRTTCDLLLDEYVKRRLDIDLLDGHGDTPLTIAMRKASLHAVKRILKAGASLERAYWIDAQSIPASCDREQKLDVKSERYIEPIYSKFAIKLIAATLPQGTELMDIVCEMRAKLRGPGEYKKSELIRQGGTEFERKCAEEVQALKRCKMISGSSLYDFLLTDDSDLIAKFCDGMTGIMDLIGGMLLNEFPIYKSLIDAKIWKHSNRSSASKFSIEYQDGW